MTETAMTASSMVTVSLYISLAWARKLKEFCVRFTIFQLHLIRFICIFVLKIQKVEKKTVFAITFKVIKLFD